MCTAVVRLFSIDMTIMLDSEHKQVFSFWQLRLLDMDPPLLSCLMEFVNLFLFLKKKKALCSMGTPKATAAEHKRFNSP